MIINLGTEYRFIILQFCSSELQYRGHWAKIKVLAGFPSFLEALGENLLPCLVQLLEASAFLGLWPLSSIFKANNSRLSSHEPSPDLLLPLSSIFKDSCD